MRRIKLSGREVAMIRVIGFGIGANGADILESTSYDPEELVGILNGMMNAGFILTDPYLLDLVVEDLAATRFEINAGYAHELRKALPVRF